MLRRLPLAVLPLALTAALLCPMTSFAQAAPAPPAVTPAMPAAPGDTSAPKKPRVNGKISSVDATAKTVTLMHGKKTVVLSVPDGTKIYKADDAKGQPTGTFADLTVDTRIVATFTGDETAPVAKAIHIRVPKAAATPATP